MVAFPRKEISILGPVLSIPKSKILKPIEVAGPSTIKSPIVTLIAEEETAGVARLASCHCAPAYEISNGVIKIIIPLPIINNSSVNVDITDFIFMAFSWFCYQFRHDPFGCV
jgi:hypothetical protein